MIKFLIDPFNIFWLLLFVVMVSWFLKRKHITQWLVISSGVWFLMVSTPLIPTQVINSLEDRYEPIEIAEIADRTRAFHILVLGGGHGFDDRLPANSLLSLNALGRLNEGVRLHRMLPNSKLVLSGFSGSGRTTQAEMLQQTAILLGVDEEATIVQKEPGNTYEEAKIYAETFGNTHPLILVTSATHMLRATRVFEHFGIKPVPSPTNYRLKGSWKRKWIGLPAMKNIENMRIGITEYAGILWYRLRK
ncbi:YdcF family protein [Aliifodinibius sp. S!AR15-10]|uniref:YdcF family protein n=1 Tax=Aliifodinibius sp. S!AR15-10 TaxID=2950437 RepID=UPI0028566FD2|nr:ElyC/SanA/YdcF family protein [Aliifodinibius sp. S!AR15-10]MDR8390268.1 YdcF family protein [Aliifodinibius sp. S!AR15-10]